MTDREVLDFSKRHELTDPVMEAGLVEADLEPIEQITRAIQVLFTDKLLNNVSVDWERDIRLRSTIVNTQWQTASRTLSTERIGRVPATFWDYLKKYLPFLEPNLIDIEIHIVHQCPHRMELEQDPHLNWLTGKAND